MRSFIVTGASASGKTTLIDEAIKRGYVNLPIHTTRKKRQGEIDGVHNVFMSRMDFETNFKNGLYMEPSLEYAENIGVYYGTPFEWLDFLSRDAHCATPITPLIAEKICSVVNVRWVSLVCADEIRRERLRARGIDSAEVEARLKTAKDHCDLPPQVMVFDTAMLSPSEILSMVAGD